MFDYNVLYSSTNPITAMILFMVYEVSRPWSLEVEPNVHARMCPLLKTAPLLKSLFACVYSALVLV